MKLRPIQRGDTFYLRRRVPRRFRGVEDRATVWISLKTDSASIAQSRAEAAWAEMVASWEARVAGDTAAAEQQMEAAKRLAQTMGFRYRPAASVARLPIDELMARIEATYTAKGQIDMTRARATLGGVERPEISLSRTLEIYWDVTQDRRADLSRNQERIWKNQRKLSMRYLVEALGDIDIAEIDAERLLDFRDFMWEMVQSGQMQRGTANKRMGEAFSILRTVNTVRRLGLTLSFDGLRFADAENNTRVSFSDTWIREKILAPGALAGLNTEARCVLVGMINTGCRPSEIAELRPEEIHLGGDIPFIEITGKYRRTKTRQSRRRIPLTGVSLDALRECPNGFPRYRDSASLTATINKYLREHGLRETPEHTTYCLRHSFEDRMLAAEIDERLRATLMGHVVQHRAQYGAGGSLEHLHRVLSAIAI